MVFKRALGFAVLLYVASFVVYLLLAALGLVSVEEYTLTAFVVGWIVNVPLVLLLAKWYFRKDAPTLKKGIQLGVFTIVVALVLDGLAIMTSLSSGASIDQFKQMYLDWPFYVTLLEIVVLCAYAGYEFDTTYTDPQESKTK